MDRRLQQINSLLTQYSKGNFKQQLKLSPVLDEIDAISAGINMVVEELKASTISKNYFTNIFNSVSDMVFVTNRKGIIKTDILKFINFIKWSMLHLTFISS